MKINIRDIKIDIQDASHRRARKDFGDIQGLALSIKHNGLLHPIVVNPIKDDKHKWMLVAGERRIRACVLNGDSQIECSIFDEMSDIDRKTCELEENVVRSDLSWQERCDALRQLDELKRKQFGSATRSRDSKGWALADTAEVVGASRQAVSQDIKLARDLREHPDIAKRVRKLPKHAARKIVRQAVEAKLLKHQIDSKKLTIDASLRLGNCCDLVDELKDESVHLLLTDPPFARNPIENVACFASYAGIDGTNISTESTMRDVYKILIPKLFKKMVPGAHFYIFHGPGWYCELSRMLRDAGFLVDEMSLIWHKMRVSVMQKDVHYMSSYEPILFGLKPPPIRVLRKPKPNVLPISAIAPQVRVHSLQKPSELLRIFIDNSSDPGELVLDPFAGSAATLIEARKMERNAVGFELDEGNYYRAQGYMKKELGNG